MSRGSQSSQQQIIPLMDYLNKPKTVYNVKEFLYKRLCVTGRKDLLKHLIRERLSQGGWLYALRWACIEYIKTKGSDKVNVSHMLSEMVPLGKKLFYQADVRRELRSFLLDFAHLYFISDESAVIPPEPTPQSRASKNVFLYQSNSTDSDPPDLKKLCYET